MSVRIEQRHLAFKSLWNLQSTSLASLCYINEKQLNLFIINHQSLLEGGAEERNSSSNSCSLWKPFGLWWNCPEYDHWQSQWNDGSHCHHDWFIESSTPKYLSLVASQGSLAELYQWRWIPIWSRWLSAIFTKLKKCTGAKRLSPISEWKSGVCHWLPSFLVKLYQQDNVGTY